MSFDPRDAFIGGVSSNCCGAAVLIGDMCADCKEHCEAESDEAEEETNPPLCPVCGGHGKARLGERYAGACYRCNGTGEDRKASGDEEAEEGPSDQKLELIAAGIRHAAEKESLKPDEPAA